MTGRSSHGLGGAIGVRGGRLSAFERAIGTDAILK
jgi:hypothetical protein